VAYPFSQRPLFSEFKLILEEQYECDYKVLPCTTDPPLLDSVSYFERDTAGRKLRAVAIFADHERMEFSDIRRICRQLEVPTQAFGLILEDWFDTDEDSEAVN
jgi:hypothetical protein